MDKLFLAWVAGFYEGEGCFWIGHQNGRRQPVARIMIGQADKRPIMLIKKKLGGHVYFRKARQKGWKDQWVWQVVNKRDLIRIVRLILPFLTFKKRDVQRKLKMVEISDVNSKKHDWAEHEIQFLKKNWRVYTDIKLAEKLSRTAMAVIQKRRKFGMRKVKWGKPRIWTANEKEILKTNYKTKTDEQIAKILNRGRYSILEKRLALGLKKEAPWNLR